MPLTFDCCLLWDSSDALPVFLFIFLALQAKELTSISSCSALALVFSLPGNKLNHIPDGPALFLTGSQTLTIKIAKTP